MVKARPFLAKTACNGVRSSSFETTTRTNLGGPWRHRSCATDSEHRISYVGHQVRGLPTAAVHLGHSRGDRAHVCTFALINSPRADGYAPMRAPVASLVNGGAAAAPSAMQHPAAAVVKPMASRNAGGAVGVASPGNAQGKARVQAAAAPPPPPPPPHHHVGAGVSAPTNDPSGPDPLAVRALLPRPAWACAWCEARRVSIT